MKYVHLENSQVTDVARVDPFSVFNADYASTFIEAPDEVDFFWRYENDEWIAPPPPDYVDLNKQQAMSLLSATDWVELPSVSNPANTPHLENVNEFLAYRTTVRAIAVSPPTEPADFPAKPDEVWV